MEDWDFKPLTTAKRKCDGESSKRFAEPTSSEVRTLTGVNPSNQWAQRALTVWIILETEDAESVAK